MESLKKESLKMGGLSFLPLALWLSCFPFGVALQQALFTLAVLLLLIFVFKAKLAPAGSPLLGGKRTALLIPGLWAGLYVLWLLSATLLNPKQSLLSLGAHPVGYLAWVLGPSLFAYFYGGLTVRQWHKASRLVVILCCVWALVACSQWLWGWRILGSSFVFEDKFRPKGFYSHPLSFAYAALLLWPCALHWTARQLRNPWAWTLLLSLGVCLVVTESRTVQFVAVVLATMTILCEVKTARHKLVLLLLLAGGLGALLLSPSPVAKKYRETFSTTGHERSGPYRDDRMAFWHVHWLLVCERPLLGHGIDIDAKYRDPYYERLGLGSFPKHYPAHNMFLQMMANGGLIGLSLFALWVSWYLRLLARLRQKNRFVWQVGWQTFAGFFVAALTQNAFQDASVRMVFTLFCAALCMIGSQLGLLSSERICSDGKKC